MTRGARMTRAPATAKLNLALVVGRLRDGRHELTTVFQRLDLADRVAVVPAPRLHITGFPEDTLVRGALEGLAVAAGLQSRWEARLTKRIPVAGGLGGGSSDAATALRLANETLDEPVPAHELHALAVRLGADVPFFLTEGPQLGEGDGTELMPLDLPQDYWVVLVLPRGAAKRSSGTVYEEFDEREGAKGYRNRRAALKRALRETERARDLAKLPPNDLASSPLAAELLALGAFRADVTGAGPVVYGLFQHLETARAARAAFRGRGATWLTAPAWYG
jgi:4-diphosphocytidyl-2-C-methyl-D-erythritol kinase